MDVKGREGKMFVLLMILWPSCTFRFAGLQSYSAVTESKIPKAESQT